MKIKFCRDMTAQQVKQKIAKHFTDLPAFTYLECDDGYSAHSDTDIDGGKAVNRRGALYICQSTKV